MDNSVVVDGCDGTAPEKKIPTEAPHDEFHMELADDCCVDVSDKKKLVEE